MDRHPIFLTPAQVLDLHRRTIERHGGDPGLRDAGLLDSAIAQPMAMYDGRFLHEGLAEMAAAYLFHLAMNHAFVDGNKRIAALASLTFLALNGLRIELDQVEFEALILSVARGESSKKAVAAYFGMHIPARPDGHQDAGMPVLASPYNSSTQRGSSTLACIIRTEFPRHV